MSQLNKNELNALKNTITTVLTEPEFLKKVAAVNSTEEISALLAEKGIEATPEQIEAIINDGNVFGEKLLKTDGELDMEALDAVAGGGVVGGLILGGIFLWGGIATGAGWGRTLTCAGIAFAVGCCAPCP